MEKYIFDCRQKLNESPKYLKRNHKVSNLPTLENEHHKSCDYLKNKIFLTFDYSYYQSIPKTASMYIGKRINDLGLLIRCQGGERGWGGDGDGVGKRGSVSQFQGTKWRRDKENVGHGGEGRKGSLHKCRKKLKTPANSMPGVGDYYFEPKNIQKRIVYDIKIRGKPSNPSKTPKQILTEKPTQPQTLSNQPQKPTPIPNSQPHTQPQPRPSKSASGKPKSKQRKTAQRHAQEEYTKFVDSIQISNVWKKLMEKHKLKGSKFDIYGYDQ